MGLLVDNAVPFKPRLIKEAILRETDCDEETAENIKNSVVNTIYNNYDNSVDKTSIRTLINAQFIKRGMLKEEEQNRKLGLSVRDFEELIHDGCKDNANMFYNPEMIAKYCYDSIAKEDALLKQPKMCRKAYEEYYIHEHDLESQELRSNCFNIDIRWIARNGLDMDGNKTIATSKPAKSLYTLLRHMCEFFMACSCVFSGGLGYPYFNVFLAPYCKGMSYKDIKQSLQMFIFDVNQSLVSRGGQICFTSVGLEFKVPEWLEDVPAITPGGVPIGTYKDYESEAELLLRAYMEIKMDGDSLGRPFRFPNDIFTIRDGVLDEYKGNIKLAHEYIAKFPTPYFLNSTHDERVCMGALTIDTPVMTNKGLKYPNELKIGDTVMTYNPDGTKDWNKLYNVIEKLAPNKVFKFTCENGYSFKVTENHKLPTKDGIKLSEDIKIGDELYNYVDKKEDYKLLKEYEFIGIFLADGFIGHKPRHQRSSNNIEFHFKKEWKILEVCSICEDLGYNYDIKERKDGTICIYVREKELRDKLVKLYDDVKNCKRFPKDVWNNKNKIYSIIIGLNFDSLIHGNAYYWSCSDKPLVEDVCFALSYLGYLTKIKVDIRKNWKPNYIIIYGDNYAPKTTTIVKSIELVDNTEPVYDLSVENNANYVCGLGGIHSQNCRTTNIDNWTGDKEKDLLNTGNFMYTSLNLPLIIMDNKDNWRDAIKYYCDVSREYLLYRKGQIEKRLYDDHLLDLLLSKDCETGEQLYDLGRLSYTIGYVGLNEAILTLTDGKEDILSNKELGKEILDIMNEKCKEYKEKDHLRWAVFSSPAESTAYKFGEYNKRKHSNAYVQGTKGNYYLTNSHHIRVSDTSNIIEHIRNGDYFHPQSLGGCIEHLWLGDSYIDPKSLFSLTQKIAKTNMNYWDYDTAFSSCSNCGFSQTEIFSECPICGSDDVITYDRVSGYYVPVKGFNKGKKQEFKDRYRHKLNK